MDAILRLMVGRTTFMIAHPCSTLDVCDMLVVAEDGILTERMLQDDGAFKPFLLNANLI
jgi:ABC-type multidrug transport system fused ATPase/permease subunit